MTSEYERMKGLLEGLGLSFKENGITNAEIYAYAKGVETVKNRLKNAYDSVFINTKGNYNMQGYVDLLDIDTERYGDELIKQQIIERLSMPFCDYRADDFKRAFSRVGSGKCTVSNKQTVFSGVKQKDLHRLGLFIKSYILMCTDALFDGDGMNFDSWDEWSQTFDTYDNFGLPCSVLETLRSDIIE